MVDVAPAVHRPHDLHPVQFAGAPPLFAHCTRPCCIAHMASSVASHDPRASHTSMLPSPAVTRLTCAPSPPPRPHFCSPHGTAQLPPQTPICYRPAFRAPLAADHDLGPSGHLNFTNDTMRRSILGWIFVFCFRFWITCERRVWPVRGAGRAAPPAERRVSHAFTDEIDFS